MGGVLQGQWRRGRKEGNGKEVSRNGDEFEGIFFNGNCVSEPQPPELPFDDSPQFDAWDEETDEERRVQRKRRILKIVRRGHKDETRSERSSSQASSSRGGGRLPGTPTRGSGVFAGGGGDAGPQL